MVRRQISLLSLIIIFFWFKPAFAGATYTFGVVPQQSAQKLVRNWGPLCAYLSQSSGVDISFATAPDIPEFERRLFQGRYDFAYMNPYHYTVFSQKPGYQPLAKQKDKKIVGIIVVHRDAPHKDCREFVGKTLVFPSPAAFAASVLPRAFFQEAGISITPKYVKSHDSVYCNVARGFYVAGGGVVRTLRNADPAVSNKLKIIWKSKSFTSHAIAVHPQVPENIRRLVLEAMLKMNDDQEAQPLLEAIGFKGFTTAADHDWDDVRALRIDLLDQLPESSF